MSINWDLYCIDCAMTLRTEGSNHAESELVRLWEQREILAGLDKLNWLDLASWRVSPWDLAKFAQRHATHNVRPRNEYGDLLGQCSRSSVCQTCGHSSPCKLDDGHEGEHRGMKP